MLAWIDTPASAPPLFADTHHRRALFAIHAPPRSEGKIDASVASEDYRAASRYVDTMLIFNCPVPIIW
jgi:hypothetical protein